MENLSINRIAGLGSILAGVFWISLGIDEVLSHADKLLNNTVIGYLSITCPVFVLFLAVVLLRQSGQFGRGESLLVIGSGLLTLSVFLYALDFDPEEGAAFGFFFFGTLVQGIGVAIIGQTYRSLGQSGSWGPALLTLGILLALSFIIPFAIGSILEDELTQRTAEIIWYSVMAVQAINWIALGLKAAFSDDRQQTFSAK